MASEGRGRLAGSASPSGGAGLFPTARLVEVGALHSHELHQPRDLINVRARTCACTHTHWGRGSRRTSP